MSQTYEILHSEGSDSVVIADAVTHDDIAEIFHNERHTVSQTVEQALETARLFAAAPLLLSALQDLLVIAGTPITDRQAATFIKARAAIASTQVSA